MSAWSIPIQAGWKLRVLSGRSIGKEFDLRPGRYVLGSGPVDISIPAPGIAPRHLNIDVRSDHVHIDDCSGGLGVHVRGARVSSARLAPGDPVTVGTFSFEFRNPGLTAAPRPTTPTPLTRLAALPLYARVGVISFAVAAALFVALALTKL